MTFFAVQGVADLVVYAVGGSGIGPDSFPSGFRLDPIHAAVHLALGVSGAYVGFWRPGWAVAFTRFFAVFYLTLAFFGTFTDVHFGMRLALSENSLHWSLGTLTAVIGFLPVFPERKVGRARA